MSQSVRGALLNWQKRDYVRMFRHDDGRWMTPDEAKAGLLDELARGHEVLPLGTCPTFDYVKGCPGHTDDAASPARPEPSDGGGHS